MKKITRVTVYAHAAHMEELMVRVISKIGTFVEVAEFLSGCRNLEHLFVIIVLLRHSVDTGRTGSEKSPARDVLCGPG